MNIDQLPTRRSLNTIDDDIRTTQAIIDKPIADLAALEREVARLSALTILDSKHRPDLFEATLAVQAQKQSVIDRAKAISHMLVLRSEKDQVIAEQRKDMLDQFNSRMNAAQNNFVTAAKNFISSYRAMQRQAQINSTIPGASFGVLPVNLVGVLVPHGWTGDLQSILNSGPLPFETKEAEAAEQEKTWVKEQAA